MPVFKAHTTILWRCFCLGPSHSIRRREISSSVKYLILMTQRPKYASEAAWKNEAEQALANANRELIARFEKKVQTTLAPACGERINRPRGNCEQWERLSEGISAGAPTSRSTHRPDLLSFPWPQPLLPHRLYDPRRLHHALKTDVRNLIIVSQIPVKVGLRRKLQPNL
jgi:hypothetical protein